MSAVKKIQTRAFGEIEIDDGNFLKFPEGILAFEAYHDFVLLPAKPEEESSFYWLQSLNEPGLAFLVMNTAELVPDYQPEIAIETLKLIQTNSIEEVETWGIVTIPPDHPEAMTINLQGPLLIHPVKKLGIQGISNNDDHQVRAQVLELIEQQEHA